MTDTQLYELVKDLPREVWPDGLEYQKEWFCSDRVYNGHGYELVSTSHAILIWEGHLSRIVNEAGWYEDTRKGDGTWACFLDAIRMWYPTRIEALVAAVKEIKSK